MNSQFSGNQSSWKQWLAGWAAVAIFVHPTIDSVWVFGADDELPSRGFVMINIVLVIIGAIVGAILADCFGRKRTLLVTLIFVAFRLTLIILPSDHWMWILNCFVEFGSGITSTVVPLYISEISCDKKRSNFMVLQLLANAIGSTILVLITLLYRYTPLDGEGIVPIDGTIFCVMVLFHAVVLAIFPETPHYLNSKQRYEEAGKSLAFFRGINHLAIQEDAIELPANARRNNRRGGCLGKLGELMQFENRRSLAMIFSLIVIRWVSGQYGNSLRIENWIENRDDAIPALSGIYFIKLIFIIFTVFTIDFFKRKIPLLVVILVCFIAAVSSLPVYNLNHWIILVLTLIEHLGHIILVGVTLAYTGEFFSINVRAIAIAVVISFEVLIRNIVLITEHLAVTVNYDGDRISPQSFYAGGIFFSALIFIMIFFPKTNKTSNFEVAIETSAGKALI